MLSVPTNFSTANDRIVQIFRAITKNIVSHRGGKCFSSLWQHIYITDSVVSFILSSVLNATFHRPPTQYFLLLLQNNHDFPQLTQLAVCPYEHAPLKRISDRDAISRVAVNYKSMMRHSLRKSYHYTNRKTSEKFNHRWTLTIAPVHTNVALIVLKHFITWRPNFTVEDMEWNTPFDSSSTYINGNHLHVQHKIWS